MHPRFDYDELSPHERERLAEFLPVELEHWLDQGELPLERQEAILTHLDALGLALNGPVPRWLREQGDPGVLPLAAGIEATLLFADITGFTALTEQLERLGPVGNEYLIKALNPSFAALVGVGLRRGGDLLAFGGDAILVAFSGPGHALVAAEAALAMQAAMRDVPSTQVPGSDEQLRLRMKVGMASGPLVVASVGAEQRRITLALGGVLATTDAMADDIEPGAIRLDPQAAELVGSAARLEPHPGGGALLHGLTTSSPLPAPRPVPEPARLSVLVRRIAALAPFLPRAVFDTMTAEPRLTVGDGEQRQAVSLFCRLDGLHALSDALGPGQALLVGRLAQLSIGKALELIEGFGGTLARVDSYKTGHKLLSTFGAPAARAADAERALSAALELRTDLGRANAELAAALAEAGLTEHVPVPDLRLCCGLNLGQVVGGLVGAPERWEYTLMGDSTNVAARLMGKGDITAQTVMIGAELHRRLGSSVVGERRDLVVKNKTEPVRALLVERFTPRLSAGGAVAGPLVGREADLRRMAEAVEQGVAARGGLVVVAGEAGVGKSRLLRELPGLLSGRALCLYTGQPGLAPASYGLFSGLLRPILGLTGAAGREAVLDRLRATLIAMLPADGAALLPAIATLLGVAAGDEPLAETPLDQQRILARALRTLLAAEAQGRPVALLCEDLHEADSASLGLLAQLLLLDGAEPLVVCATLRTRDDGRQAPAVRRLLEEAAQAPGLVVAQVTLRGFAGEAGLAFVRQLEPEISPEAAASLVETAAGNPLFLQVLVAAVRERNGFQPTSRGLALRASPTELRLKPTLHELITAQIDQLPSEARSLARAAAVAGAAGRDFDPVLLGAIVGHGPALESRLQLLARAQILDPSPVQGAGYRFRHALYQQVAYRQVLLLERRAMHRRAGLALDEAREGGAAVPLTALAYHCYEGGERELAARYALLAGQQEQRAYANREARVLLRRARELARSLGRADDELAARVALGDLQVHLGRFAAACRHLESALVLARELPPGPHAAELQARCHRLMATVADRSGDYATAERECLAGLALRELLSASHLEVARLRGQYAEALMRRGAFAEAEEVSWQGLNDLGTAAPDSYREQAILLQRLAIALQRREARDQSLSCMEQALKVAQQGGDPLLTAWVEHNFGYVLQEFGEPGIALRYYRRSLETKERIGDVVNQLRTLVNMGTCYQDLGELDTAMLYFERVRIQHERIGVPELHGSVTINMGSISFERGAFAAAQPMFEAALATFEQLREVTQEALCHYLLGAVLLERGSYGAARTHAEELLALAERMDAPAYRSCALRLLGQAALSEGRYTEAACQLAEAWKLQEPIGDEYDQLFILRAQAKLAWAVSDRPRARELAALALPLARDQGIAWLVADLEAMA